MTETGTRAAFAVLANKKHRIGPTASMPRLMREFEPFFRASGHPTLFLIGGSLRSLRRYGTLRGYPTVVGMAPGSEGGNVELANKVIPPPSTPTRHVPPPIKICEDCGRRLLQCPTCKQEKRNLPQCPTCFPDDSRPQPQIDTVFFLIDPADQASMSPGALALERECVVNSVTFIGTYAAAREWLTLQWHTSLTVDPVSLDHYFLSLSQLNAVHVQRRAGSAFEHVQGGVELDLDVSAGHQDQTIGLIAHTEFKDCMARFSNAHAAFLGGFERRIGTATTAAHLNAQIEDGFVTGYRSGPLGGDVQIAENIRQGECQKVIFFEDPHYSREHESDIRLLERMARSTPHPVFCLHDHSSAERWVSMWEEARNSQGKPTLMSLISAYREMFPQVDLVLADPVDWNSPRDRDVAERELWSKIVQKAVPYLIGLIAHNAERRRNLGERSHIGVAWRRTVFDVLAGIAEFRDELSTYDQDNVDHRLNLGYRYVKVANVTVVPLLGVRGALDGIAEANQNAAFLAEELSPMPQLEPPQIHALSVPAFAFRPTSVPEPAPITDRPVLDVRRTEHQLKEANALWDTLDVGLFTCHPLAELGPPYTEVARYADKIGGAVSEVCGLFFDRDGTEVTVTGRFERLGINLPSLRRLKAGGGSMMVAGAIPGRAEAALAALRSGIVSVFVTDLNFAWDILELHLSS